MSGAVKSEQASAWTTFWEEQGPQSRCLAAASPRVHQNLSDHWRSFAVSLKPATRVLDVGCGAGNVARAFAAQRCDLNVIGVDVADIEFCKQPRVELLAATAMESLPFARASFGAAVSQFGYEYARAEQAARELGRVLAGGARFSFLIHHAHSPISRSERIHNQALKALMGEALCSAFLSADRAALDWQMRLLARRFAGEEIIALVAKGLRTGVGGSLNERTRIWQAIVSAIAPDRTLSDALLRCCVAPEELDDWLAPLRPTFEISPPSVLTAGEPLAWRIEGTRLS